MTENGAAFAKALAAALGAEVGGEQESGIKGGEGGGGSDGRVARVRSVSWVNGIAPRAPGLCCCAVEHMDRISDENIEAVYKEHTL